jgi:hypothetical protein
MGLCRTGWPAIAARAWRACGNIRAPAGARDGPTLPASRRASLWQEDDGAGETLVWARRHG